MSLYVSEWQSQEYSWQFVVKAWRALQSLDLRITLVAFKLCNGINWSEGAAIDVTIDLNYVPFLHQCNFTIHRRITKEL